MSRAEAEAGVKALISHVGEDVEREGLQDTPARVVKAWAELTSGYNDSPEQILSKVFLQETAEGMVLLRAIPFVSLCEHHCLPFSGVAHVAYIPAPGRGVVGLSKLARLVHCFARRLQVQERLTSQVTSALDANLKPLGSACVIKASHSCMALRGVRTQAEMVTSSLTGVFRQPEVRQEFFALSGVING